MIVKNIKIISLLICLMGSISSQLQATHLYQAPFEGERQELYASLQASKESGIEEQLQALKEEEQALTEEYLNLLNMTYKQWCAFKYELQNDASFLKMREEALKTAIPMNKILKKAAQKIIKRIGIDTNKLTYLDCTQDNLNNFCGAIDAHLMYVTQNRIHISQAWQNSVATDLFKFSVTHECMHLLHDDSFMRTSLESALFDPEFNVDKTIAQSFLKKYSHFVEKRADILACCVDIKYLIAYYNSLKDSVDDQDEQSQLCDIETATHPSLKTQLVYTATLYNSLMLA